MTIAPEKNFATDQLREQVRLVYNNADYIFCRRSCLIFRNLAIDFVPFSRMGVIFDSAHVWTDDCPDSCRIFLSLAL